MKNSGEILKLQNVALSFGKNVVHRDISFAIRRSEVVTLLGPSGSGKTVILKMISGLLSPTAGEIVVMDKNISQLEEDDLQDIRAHIGMLFQGAALFDSLTVFDNIAYGLRERKRPEDEIKKIVSEELALVGLPGIENKYPSALSGGQRKRVGLARALATKPSLMLYDEPTTGLDPTATKMIGDMVLQLKEELGITSLIVTHDIQTAARVSDRLILINKGEVVADGPTEELISENQTVIEFIQGTWQDNGYAKN